jgi:hypothetical protein
VLSIILVLGCPLLLLLALRAKREEDAGLPVLPIYMAAYALRMMFQLFGRELPIFSYGASGNDAEWYEMLAYVVSRMWAFDGIRYMTSDDLPMIGPTSLPPNLFALIMYVDSDRSRFGCVAIIAILACLTCLNMYRLAVEFGADRRVAFWIMAGVLYGPGYFYLTSDMYKDGMVAFCVTLGLSCSMRLARRFSTYDLAIGVLALFTLWFVRYYLIFLVSAPLLIGLVGVRSKTIVRPFIMTVAIVCATALIGTTSRVADRMQEQARVTFDSATDANSRGWNAQGGSGVAFDDAGSPYGAIGAKLAYTLFSPFPWQGGSIALQIGKVDALYWYYLCYRIWLASKRLWLNDRRLLLMFFSFLVPITFAYALTVSNIGLIVRQRMPIVLAGALLATLSWPARALSPFAWLAATRRRTVRVDEPSPLGARSTT